MVTDGEDGLAADLVGSLVSVRSEVWRTVEPDSVVLHGQVSITRDDKAGALRAAAVAVDSLKAILSEFGGTALSATTVRHKLTWSTQQISTQPEFNRAKQGGLTGRITANVAIRITIRDFTHLGELADLLAGNTSFELGYAAWDVDAENPAWSDLRADAIRGALRKGRDYAAALGASLVRVEHVADVGLLSGEDSGTMHQGQRFAAMAGSEGGSPSLDPVPQNLVARIEARFRTTAVGLPPS